jgi:hypothetical protein
MSAQETEQEQDAHHFIPLLPPPLYELTLPPLESLHCALTLHAIALPKQGLLPFTQCFEGGRSSPDTFTAFLRLCRAIWNVIASKLSKSWKYSDRLTSTGLALNESWTWK